MTGSLASPQDRLHIAVSSLTGYQLVVLTGDIDVSTHARFDEAMTRALAAAAGALIIDLTEVVSCGSHAINTLVRLRHQARASGLTIVLVGVHGRVAKLLRMTQLDGEFYQRPDLPTTIRWLETGTR